MSERQNQIEQSQQSAGYQRAYRHLLVLFLFLLCLLEVPSAGAQGITGTITGTVTDATGAAIPGATVTIRSLGTNQVHTVTSSDAGTYTVPQLAPGQYSIVVTKPAFQTFKEASDSRCLIDQVGPRSMHNSRSGDTNVTIDVTSGPRPYCRTEDTVDR